MSFDQQNFAPIAGQTSPTPTVFGYRSTDNFDEVRAPKYFFKKRFQIEVGDLIYAVLSNGVFLFKYEGTDVALTVLAPGDGSNTELEFYAAIDAQSLQDQGPDNVGEAYQISFGPAQNDANDPIMLAADGTVTVNGTGLYTFTIFLTISREVSTSEALLFFRLLVNDQPQLNPVGLIIEDDEHTQSVSFDISRRLEAGDTIKVEMIRDSSGFNDGSVKSLISTDGWGNSASASLRIYGIRQRLT